MRALNGKLLTSTKNVPRVRTDGSLIIETSTSNSYVELYSRTGQFLYGDTLTTSSTYGAHFTDGPNGNILFTYTDWLSGGVAVINVQDIGSGLVSQYLPGVAPADITAPTVSIFNPADAATGVAVGSNITLTFNEAIQKGTGNIEIRQGSATGTLVESFAAATSTRLTFSGSTLTIDPTSDLANGTQYFVTFANGSVKDMAGNSYAGTTTYDFTTVDTSAPVVTTFSPVDGLSGVVVCSNIALTFNEAIQKGAGNIEIRQGSATGALVESFAAATSTRLTSQDRH